MFTKLFLCCICILFKKNVPSMVLMASYLFSKSGYHLYPFDILCHTMPTEDLSRDSMAPQ